MSDVKPSFPPMTGRHYAPDIDAGHHVSMSYDSAGNEMASDPAMHTEATPGAGSSNYSAPHYANEFSGGYGSSAGGTEPSREKTNVEAQSTERGKES